MNGTIQGGTTSPSSRDKKRGKAGKKEIESRPLGSGLGIEIRELDLRPDLEDSSLTLLQKHLDEDRVVCLSGQELSLQRFLEVGRRFGATQVNPILGGGQGLAEVVCIEKRKGDRDIFSGRLRLLGSYLANPPKAALLYNPPSSPSFDMIFSSLALAWGGLSDLQQELFANLIVDRSAVSEFGPEAVDPRRYTGQAPSPLIYSDTLFQSVQHPMVRVEPQSGEKSLYIDEAFSSTVDRLNKEESRAILDFLADHCRKPEYGCRITVWPGAVLMWDARAVSFMAPTVPVDKTRLCYMVALNAEEDVTGPNDPVSEPDLAS